MKALQMFVVALILLAAGWFGHQYFGETVSEFLNQKPQEEITETPDEGGMVCIQVITPARNPDTGEIKEFPTPCDVPEGWEKIENDVPGLDLQVQ